MGTIYDDGTYLEKHPTWDEEHSPKKAEWVIEMLVKHRIIPHSICEVGCGTGGILHAVGNAYKDANCLGYDISPQAIGIAKKREHDKLHFQCSDFNLDTNHFDLILCMDVIEHVEDYIAFTTALRNKAEYVMFHIPLDMSVQKLLRQGRLLKDRSDVGHLHYFCKETALATLIYAGFKVIDSRFTSLAEFPNSESPALANIMRKILFRLAPDMTVKLGGGYELMVLAK